MSRAAGWISPIVVAAGRIAGVWDLADDQVRVSLFPGADQPTRKELDAEVAHTAHASGRSRLKLQLS